MGCRYAASPKAPAAEVERVAGETGQVVLQDETREEIGQGVEAEGLVVTSAAGVAAGVIGPGKAEVVAVCIGEPSPSCRSRWGRRSLLSSTRPLSISITGR